jgi:hypothetical protein
MKINKLINLASMSGGGKSTYANKNFDKKLIMPDTNQNVYEVYHKLFRQPALKQNLTPDMLTGVTLWSVKLSSDLTFLEGLKLGQHYGDLPKTLVNMRTGWDILIYDELYMNRNIIDPKEMYNFVNKIESYFHKVEYKIWDMQDDKIIEELMSRNDDRAHLFDSDPKVYKEWQKHYVARYKEIMDMFNYDYELKIVKYNK